MCFLDRSRKENHGGNLGAVRGADDAVMVLTVQGVLGGTEVCFKWDLGTAVVTDFLGSLEESSI